ncbi:SLC35A4 upstream open reading frame protein-like [Zalophus californianus]|uniref:SLC35A4 upstream open reading frame protein-like n=1 Tax=Zalophus californianus TaxID=9704 RepID=A0A6J2C156_ZALCA|nr:SLC35A4 upstream open reading frame protein-like [Zalophus californianus]
MVDYKDFLPKLKDLAFLKNQLEHLQQHVEDEVSSGVSQDGLLMSSPFLKVFLAGYVVAKLRHQQYGLCCGYLHWHLRSSGTCLCATVEKTSRDYLWSL